MHFPLLQLHSLCFAIFAVTVILGSTDADNNSSSMKFKDNFKDNPTETAPSILLSTLKQ